MSHFDKMNRNEKRSARLLALQLLYANEISNIDTASFFDNLFDLKSSINGASKKNELISNFDNYSDIAFSVLPKAFDSIIDSTKQIINEQESDDIIKTINNFQRQLDSFKSDIQSYALLLSNLSIENIDKLDKEIISRSKNWDSKRITLMDKLILRLVLAEIIFVDEVPPKVSIAEGIEIAKTMSTDDSSAFVNGILDSYFNDLLKNKNNRKKA